MIRPINKKLVEMNLATAIKNAVIKKDTLALHKAAQNIIDAGYELEDMNITPKFLEVIMSALILTKFSPKYNG